MSTDLSPQIRFRGCLLGGAVGDALGAPVEFMTSAEIASRFGPRGIRDFVPEYGRLGAITDDTQMTLFTAEGFIRACVRYENKGICHPPSIVHHAYLRWLKTQGEDPESLDFKVGMDGWIVGLRPLWSRRGPGDTCLSALRKTVRLGAPAKNDSKGCGAVMRTAPIGLGALPDTVFQLSAEIAALTHGHPTAALTTGFLAVVISQLVRGAALQEAIEIGKHSLRAQPDHAECLSAVERAEMLATTGHADVATVERLGGGWIAEEAVAIALYCVLATPNFEEATILAVNHSGDSDSTGAIAGNIAGVLYGTAAIPTRWLDRLELRDEITAIADDLLGLRNGVIDLEDDKTWNRYPGW